MNLKSTHYLLQGALTFGSLCLATNLAWADGDNTTPPSTNTPADAEPLGTPGTVTPLNNGKDVDQPGASGSRSGAMLYHCMKDDKKIQFKTKDNCEKAGGNWVPTSSDASTDKSSQGEQKSGTQNSPSEPVTP